MNVYKVTGFSSCGSYFVSYLQSVTVLANSEQEAMDIVKNSKYKNDFIREDLDCYMIASDVKSGDIVDTFRDTDY